MKTLKQRMAAAISKVPRKYRDPEDLDLTNIQEKSELGSVWIFNRCLVDNRTYNSVNDIKKDPNYYELESIWGGIVPTKWLESYFKQQKTMLQKFGSLQWEEFQYGKGSFIDFVKEVLSRVRYKDEKVVYTKWNPSDIWMIQKGKKNDIKNFINENIVKSNRQSQTLAEFNDLLRGLIKNKQLIGVSLKKIGTGDAQFVFVNVNVDGFVSELRSQNNHVKSIQYKSNTLESVILFENKNKIQITLNSTSRFSGLKFESVPHGSGGRGGKVVLSDLDDLMDINGISFERDYKKYPQTLSEFMVQEQKQEENKTYKSICEKLYGNGIISKPYQETLDSIIKFYNEGNHKGVCKLMQLQFFKSLTDIVDKNKRDEFLTDMFYLGIKLGDKFAPHGKLY